MISSFRCHYPQYGNLIPVISRYEGPGDHGEIAGRATAAQARPAARRNARTIFGAVCETLGAFAALRSRLSTRVNSVEEPARGLFVRFEVLRCPVALVHGEKTSNRITHGLGNPTQERGKFSHERR